MPLAVELSAGWIDMLSMGDITAEIEQGLDLLETSTQDIPGRQRSVRAIFEGTWRRLSPEEQSLFGKLCIFRGGFTRKAAKEVAGASLRQLAGLLSKSLLLFDRKTNRYDIHRLLRQYGLERLVGDPAKERAVRDRFSAYCLETIAALRVRGAYYPIYFVLLSDFHSINR
jgi:predicted ATPase